MSSETSTRCWSVDAMTGVMDLAPPLTDTALQFAHQIREYDGSSSTLKSQWFWGIEKSRLADCCAPSRGRRARFCQAPTIANAVQIALRLGADPQLYASSILPTDWWEFGNTLPVHKDR